MMNRNAYISEHGQLSSEILLNVAEILTLRLPAGNGENLRERTFFEMGSFGVNFLSNLKLQVMKAFKRSEVKLDRKT